MTRVAVGSGNPVKVAATAAVAERLFDGEDDTDDGDNADGADRASGPTVAGEAVDSGVPEQPVGRAETITGAENRAARALEADDEADYGVGIEGGVAPLDRRPGLYVIMWAAVADGERLARGAGPAVRLPDDVAERIRDGEELGPVLDDVLGTEGTKRGGGAAGVLTDGAIDRQSALEHAVACAFGPFVSDLYER